MKTNIITLTLLSLMSLNSVFAQDRTTVTANNSEISDNLDLRAVASIFGDSKDLNDFEYRLNNPEYQISNLDLNDDNKVDYLRVIETVEGNAHLIIIQSVLGRDMYQDIATVEVTKDRDNRVQVQVVGDVYMYGTNYIYEPVYAYTPVIYTSFWAPRYVPYYSSWYWGYYPTYYVAWNPFPIFRYRSNINVWINFNHHYNYVNTRNCGVVYNNYYRGRRGNAYETRYPNRSFINRHEGYANRHELDKTRNIRTVGTRNSLASNDSRGNSRNDNGATRSATRSDNGATRSATRNDNGSTRSATRTENGSTRTNTNGNGSTRNNSVNTTRNNGSDRSATDRGNNRTSSVGNSNRTATTDRTFAQNNSRGNSNQSSSVRTAPSNNSSSRSNNVRSASPSQSSSRNANVGGGSSQRGNSSGGGNARGNGNSRR